MLYYGLSNIFQNNMDMTSYDRTNFNISKYYNFGLVLKWNNSNLWGVKINSEELVMYSKVKVGDYIPPILNRCFSSVKYFEQVGKNVKTKYPGRYIADINGKKWVLDVIFNVNTRNKNFTDDDYLSGTTGVYSSWNYDFNDANMIDFVMEKLEMIEPEKRTMVNVLRLMMSEFSSENSPTGLINGKWGGDYSDGMRPTYWDYPSEIFLSWKFDKTPVKYGQCWVFAECFTVCMRFLGIPCRTIFAVNSHINPSLSGFVNFFENESFLKDGDIMTEEDCLYRNIDPIRFIKNSSVKGDIFDGCSIYSTRDSMWNIHYWNEVYISREDTFEWEVIDSCPYLPSTCEPYLGKHILGPSKKESIKNGTTDFLYDYKYLHATVNSPFLIWINETTVLNGDIITVPYVHSIIYPFFPEKSTMTQNNKTRKLIKKRVELETLKGKNKINITNSYVMNFSDIYRIMIETNPIIFYLENSDLKTVFNESDNKEKYYVQQISLDFRNEIFKIRRQQCKLDEITPILIDRSTVRVVTILIIKDENFWVQLIDLEKHC